MLPSNLFLLIKIQFFFPLRLWVTHLACHIQASFSSALDKLSLCSPSVPSTAVTLKSSSHNGRSASGGGLPVHRHPRRYRPPAVPRGVAANLPLRHPLLEEEVHSLQGERSHACVRGQSPPRLYRLFFFCVLLSWLIFFRCYCVMKCASVKVLQRKVTQSLANSWWQWPSCRLSQSSPLAQLCSDTQEHWTIHRPARPFPHCRFCCCYHLLKPAAALLDPICFFFLFTATPATFVAARLLCLSAEWGDDRRVPRQSCWLHGRGRVLHVVQ